MRCFPAEINQRIIEEVGFEYGPQLREYISIFKALNSILELKPIIAKYISIWISIPSDVRFNYLRHSETLRSLRDCTDSFFMMTNDEPVEFKSESTLGEPIDCGPLIFDVHNYLGMKQKEGLNLAIQSVDVLIENLIFLSDKRPKRILELVLPSSNWEPDMTPDYKRFVIPDRFADPYRSNTLTRRLGHIALLTGAQTMESYLGTPVWKRYNVPIDHQIFDFARLSYFDEYPFDEKFRKLELHTPALINFLKVDREFWGPTPFLDGLNFEDVIDLVDVKAETQILINPCSKVFRNKFKKCRIHLWSDYQNQLFLGEYNRLNFAAYHDLIETLACEQWD